MQPRLALDRPSRAPLISLIAALTACSGAPDGATESASTTAATSTSSASTTETSTTAGTTTNPAPTCGDGDLDPGELCDDGDAIDGNGCNNDCGPSAEQIWIHVEDGGFADRALDITATGDHLVVAGLKGVDTQSSDAWLLALEVSGDVAWQRSYDAEASEQFNGVGASDDGHLVAVGSKRPIDHEIWIVGLDPAGAIVWEDALDSGLGDDYATDVAVAADGESTAVALVATAASSEILVRRYTAAGSLAWEATYANLAKSNFSPLGPAVAIGDDGRVWVGLRAKTVESSFPELLFALPSDGGAPLWSYTSAAADGAIFGLTRAGDGAFTAASLTDPDQGFVVARRSAMGDPVWSSDECTGRSGRDLAVDPRDGAIVAIGDGPGSGSDNIRLCKFTPEGALLWGKDIDGEGHGDDSGWAVTVLPTGVIVAAGAVIGGLGTQDAWIAAFRP